MKKVIDFHPITLMIFFVSVIFYTMYTMNPVVLTISLLGSLVLLALLEERRKFLKHLLLVIVITIVISLTNHLFTHRGETVLFKIGRTPFTLEAFVYGIAMSMMINAIITWFNCYNYLVSSDKFIYLFGRVFPSLAISISMGLAYVPLFMKKSQKIRTSQKNLGMYTTTLKDRIRISLRSFSILVTWGLENSIETADSMNARGFGEKKRTRFSIYKYSAKDFLFSFINVVLLINTIIATFLKKFDFEYYIQLSVINLDLYSTLSYSLFLLLVLLPVVFILKEEIKWKYLK